MQTRHETATQIVMAIATVPGVRNLRVSSFAQVGGDSEEKMSFFMPISLELLDLHDAPDRVTVEFTGVLAPGMEMSHLHNAIHQASPNWTVELTFQAGQVLENGSKPYRAGCVF